MSDATLPGGPPSGPRFSLPALRNRLARSRRFQAWAARFPLTRPVARREGEALFDLVAGFCHSQMLRAVVELGLLELIVETPMSQGDIARALGLQPQKAKILLRSATAIGLTEPAGENRFRTSRRGAAMLGVPGLADMVRHHDILYRDLADPVAFLRGETDPELAQFWPYVFGQGAQSDPEAAARYSKLMADSQTLVAEETLAAVSLRKFDRLMDVGGGTGAFLSAALKANPNLTGVLYDLPDVVPHAAPRFDQAGQTARVTIHPGNFRCDNFPVGVDIISLVRVLYDHRDDTVAALLAKAYAALPPGGRLMISEPMSGGDRPERAGDAYFALYCAAMGTGTTRCRKEIAALVQAAGFTNITMPRVSRPFVTGIVMADKPT